MKKVHCFTNVDVVQVSVLLEICACMSSNNALNIYCFCLHFVMMLQSYKLYTDVINPAHNEISKIPLHTWVYESSDMF